MCTFNQLLYFGYDVLFLGHKAFLNSFSFSVCTTIVRIRSFVSAKMRVDVCFRRRLGDSAIRRKLASLRALQDNKKCRFKSKREF